MKENTKVRIREVMDEAIAQGETAGASLLLIRDGHEIHFEARGFANVEKEIPYSRDRIVRLFSMSKPVTAAAAMILMERGQLDLSMPVTELLPGFEQPYLLENGKHIAAPTPVTVFHLLNMTAGITYGDPDTEQGRAVTSYLEQCQARMHGPEAVSTKEFAIGLSHIPLAFEPDTSWKYGLCADVLGAVIEQICGVSFGDFLQENIFAPLGMKDTGFYVPAEKQDRLADAYITMAPGDIRPFSSDHLVTSYRKDEKPAFESGGAGLVSTIDDYARFAQMLLHGGSKDGVQILKPETVAFMTRGRLTDVQQRAMRKWVGLEGFTYSNFLRIRDERLGNFPGLSRHGEYGWDGWMGCYFANFPAERVTMVLTQQKAETGTTPMTRKIRNLLLTDEEIFAARK